MTNDNAPPATPIEERFRIGLIELIGMCVEAGMTDDAFIAPLKEQLLLTRQNVMKRTYDDEHNAKHGKAPRTPAQLRQDLELEDHEPIPPRGNW